MLANKTYNQVITYLEKDKRILLPIGSTEQHGPDACLGVDHITATGIAYMLAEITGILCAPPLNIGMAMHHSDFPGTIALRPTTYINVIMDVVRSLKKSGFREVIIINGHGGNKGPFLNALQEAGNEFAEINFEFVNWWVMPGLEKNIIEGKFGEKEGYHATPTEISLTMALTPGMMTMPESYNCPNKPKGKHNVEWVMPAKFKELYPDGVMRADYSGASEEIGLEVLEAAVTEIIEELKLLPQPATL